MKRIAAVLMVLIMVVPAVACASSANERLKHCESQQEYVRSILDAFVQIYALSKSMEKSFDEDYIMQSYAYFMEYLALRRVESSELNMRMRELSGTPELRRFNDGMQLKIEYSFVFVEKTISEKFASWASGDLSDEEFASYLMPMIKSMVLSEENK